MTYQLLGVVIALLLWQFFTSQRFLNEQFSRGFSPTNTFHELMRFLSDGAFLHHALPSLNRVGLGPIPFT